MNLKELAENLGLEEKDYLELIELFVETGMSDLEAIQSAIDAGSAEQAANSAHSLKGASGNLGLMKIYEIAKEMESEARNGRLDGIVESAYVLKRKMEEIAEHPLG